jgi:hypothetical protein
MADRRFKIRLPHIPHELEAVEVPVMESTDRWTEVKLADGSTLRIKVVVVSAARVEGQWDPDGNPLYTVRANQIMTVADSPQALRKPDPAPGGQTH